MRGQEKGSSMLSKPNKERFRSDQQFIMKLFAGKEGFRSRGEKTQTWPLKAFFRRESVVVPLILGLILPRLSTFSLFHGQICMPSIGFPRKRKKKKKSDNPDLKVPFLVTVAIIQDFFLRKKYLEHFFSHDRNPSFKSLVESPFFSRFFGIVYVANPSVSCNKEKEGGEVSHEAVSLPQFRGKRQRW